MKNDNLRRLVIAADAWCDQNCNNTELYSQMWTQKYSELLIEECMKLCQVVADDADQMKNSGFLTDAGKNLYAGCWGGAMNCRGSIANHFGVIEDDQTVS